MKFSIKDIRVSKSGLIKTTKKLAPYIKSLEGIGGSYENSESFIFLPEDKKILSEVDSMIRGRSGKDVSGVIVIGIGASSLDFYSVLRFNMHYHVCNY